MEKLKIKLSRFEQTEIKKNKKMKNLRGIKQIAFVGLGVLAMVACKKEGCTDPLADNYDEKANHDDGSCTYDGTGTGPVTSVAEDVTSPTTWSAGTIEVCEDITISAALTIEPGTTLEMCAGASLTVTETGSFNAVGTASQPIIIKGEVETAGYWQGLNISSNNPNNRLEFVTIKDGGTYWGWNYALVNIDGSAQVALKNSTFSNADQVAVYAEESTSITEFSNNTFSNNGTVGLAIHASHIGSLDEASNYNDGNTDAYIHVIGGDINSDQTWRKTTTPLLFLTTVDVNAGLTINPGSHLLFESGNGLDVKESGWLSAVGTAGENIQIEGRFASAGYFAGVRILSNNPNNKMAYVQVNDGGSYWGWNYSGIDLSGRLELDNCTISNSNSWGMYVGSSSTLICGGVTQTDAAGVTAYNTLSGNGAGADADCAGGGCTVYFE